MRMQAALEPQIKGCPGAGSSKDTISLQPREGAWPADTGASRTAREHALLLSPAGLLQSVLVAVSRPWFCLVLSVADNRSVQHISSRLTEHTH